MNLDKTSIEKFALANFCSLVLGSSWTSKDWPVSGYLGLVKLLLKNTDLNIVLLGTSDHVASAESLLREVKSDRVKSLAGKTNLLELSSVLESSDFVIGPDSGPGHLASAVNTPYVSLFGPTDPQRVCSYANQHLIIQANIGCSPCGRKKCPGLDRICMRLISPELVFSKLQEK